MPLVDVFINIARVGEKPVPFRVKVEEGEVLKHVYNYLRGLGYMPAELPAPVVEARPITPTTAPQEHNPRQGGRGR